MATNPSVALRFEIATGSLRAAAAELAQVSQLTNLQTADDADARGTQNTREELWTARRGEALVAAVRGALHAGHSAMLGVPRSISGEPSTTSAKLIAAVLRAWQSRGIRLVQALLPLDHGAAAEILVAGGLRHLANLLYLVSLEQAFPDAPPAPLLSFMPTTSDREAHLAQIIEQTYLGTLDCPGLEAARDIDDVLAGYRATGPFAPERWLIASHAGLPIGCLLLTDDPRHNQMELTYLGVVPEARGHGYGLLLARHAQWLARETGRSRVVVAVDAANGPALSAYAAAGFIGWDHRSVYVQVLDR